MKSSLEAEEQALRKVQPDHGDVSQGGSGEDRGTPRSLTSSTGIYGAIHRRQFLHRVCDTGRDSIQQSWFFTPSMMADCTYVLHNIVYLNSWKSIVW